MANPSSHPISPHLQVYRWTVTMAASIFQRATGVALYVGSLLLTAWIGSAALGESAFNTVKGFLGSPIGMIILIGYTWAICFHLINGLRFLFWDAGYGFDKATATKTGWGAFIGSAVLTIALWALVFTTGGGN